MTDKNLPIVEVDQLTKTFAKKTAIDQLSVSIGGGEVFGLVGENGAGKTTLIRHLLGLLIPTSGRVEIFGMDPVKHPSQVLSQIGYVSEDRDLPNWMKIGQFLNFSKAFYPNWDDALELELMESFGLGHRQQIRSLSRGERARVCLVNALSHRPALLLLDEPSSGLDPVVRRDVLSAIIRTVADEGRTVIFSSHLLDEVQRVADRICMIDHGSMVFDDQLDSIFEQHHSYLVQFPQDRETFPMAHGVLETHRSGREWTVLSLTSPNEFQHSLAGSGGKILESRRPSLDEIFVARTRSHGSVSGTTSFANKKDVEISPR